MDIQIDDIPGRRGQAMAESRRWIYEQALQGKLFATASSEPGSGPRLSQIKTNYRRVSGRIPDQRPEGFRLDG